MKLYTLKEVSEITRLKVSTLYQHVTHKHLTTYKKTYRWGKRISYVTEQDLNYFLFHHFFDKKKEKKRLQKYCKCYCISMLLYLWSLKLILQSGLRGVKLHYESYRC